MMILDMVWIYGGRMKKVLILGANGMLGSMVTDYLSKKEDIELSVSMRNNNIRSSFIKKYNNIKVKYLDFSFPVDYSLFTPYLIGYDFIINCVGVTKPFIKENDFGSIKTAIEINSILPYYLKEFCEKHKTILIQILTDCVFSGKSNNYYEENDLKGANDIYGKSKMMGEYLSDNVINLRTSIIGPEIDSKKFLFEWFLQNENESIDGYVNHYWNGITTLAYAKIVYGMIKNDNYKDYVNGFCHIFSNYVVNKYDLLYLIKDIFKKDIHIEKISHDEYISRKLYSIYLEYVKKIWENAGYRSPGIEFLLDELKEYIENEWRWKK